ncbi:MAG: type II toxin-antitoxin system RelE/ParE family toxin [Pseudomonas sp.]|nr:type II toxin-antitoxin system RelE/ParE family toxin [Pseudomonas sp.]
MKKTEVSFTSTAEHSINELQRNLARRRGDSAAREVVSSLIRATLDRLSDHPLSCPICLQASSLGVLNYREFNKDGYRIIYEYFPSENLVVVGLVMSQQQSVEQMLISYCLHWDL